MQEIHTKHTADYCNFLLIFLKSSMVKIDFPINQHATIKEISQSDEQLAAAIQAMRENRVRRIPDYDGAYGTIIIDQIDKLPDS